MAPLAIVTNDLTPNSRLFLTYLFLVSQKLNFSVIQYQLYLMTTGKSEREAYHIATEEFYLHRAQEETEARVAKAQAMAFGLKPRRSFVMNGLKREEAALREAERNTAKF